MLSFRLEDHVFRLTENRLRLDRHLNRFGKPWELCADLVSGMAMFVERETARPLLHGNIHVLGTQTWEDGTFLWGWADPTHPVSTTEFGYLRQDAEKLGEIRFHYSHPFRLSRETEAEELALIASGYLGGFTYLRQDDERGSRFLALRRSAAAETGPSPISLKYAAIDLAIRSFAFDHRSAALAYLGEPFSTVGKNCVYVVNNEPLALTFDRHDRITDLPRNAVPLAPSPRRPERIPVAPPAPPERPSSGPFSFLNRFRNGRG